MASQSKIENRVNALEERVKKIEAQILVIPSPVITEGDDTLYGLLRTFV